MQEMEPKIEANRYAAVSTQRAKNICIGSSLFTLLSHSALANQARFNSNIETFCYWASCEAAETEVFSKRDGKEEHGRRQKLNRTTKDDEMHSSTIKTNYLRSTNERGPSITALLCHRQAAILMKSKRTLRITSICNDSDFCWLFFSHYLPSAIAFSVSPTFAHAYLHCLHWFNWFWWFE